MITTEQLVDALEALAPHERELLELSLRRRVPDEALATLFEVDEAEVARRRAAAIDKLSTLLNLQRGEDLGNVLKSLLEQSTWAALGARAAPEDEPGEGRADPIREARAQPIRETRAEPRRESRAEPRRVEDPKPAEDPTPVLELLSERRKRVKPEAAPTRPRRPGPVALAVGALAVLAVVIGTLALSSGDSEQPTFEPSAPKADESPARSEPFASGSAKPLGQNLTATVRGRAVIYSKPGGGKKRTLSARTQFDSPRVFGVARRQGDWLAVQAPELRNGEVGWLRASDARLDDTPWTLHADLSRKRIEVRKDRRPVRSFAVAIGNPRHPTPQGRFSVTDKLKVTDADSPYGCCVLALTGHQVDLPPDWPGGDRLAVHATRDVSSIGKPVSLGGMRAHTEQARWLIATIPLGSPIYITA